MVQMTEPRKIIHIDMDAFYASVEQRDFPELRGKAIAVGGGGARGVVAAASYEARFFGVRSAMPSVTAIRKCPHLIFVKPRFNAYKKASSQIREIFHSHTDLVEPLSLDEAYLDVTTNKKNIRSATIIAKEIRQAIYEITGLTASAGISYNKFLAKIASDINKPNGSFVIEPKDAEVFLEQLPIEQFHGIGKATAKRMKAMGIYAGVDLKKRNELDLAKSFGKSGRHYYRIVRGIDHREVRADRIRKSVGVEETFTYDLTEQGEMLEQLSWMAEELERRIEKSGALGKTLTLKIKHNDFSQQTRSQTLSTPTNRASIFIDLARELLRRPHLPTLPVRLLGLSLSGLVFPQDSPGGYQLTLEF